MYRNCKQRGICDLVFWILRDTALLTLKTPLVSPELHWRWEVSSSWCSSKGVLHQMFSTRDVPIRFTGCWSWSEPCTSRSRRNTYICRHQTSSYFFEPITVTSYFANRLLLLCWSHNSVCCASHWIESLCAGTEALIVKKEAALQWQLTSWPSSKKITTQ